ncbi:MAG TPA: DNA translocase FtsK 4TM domain-containing protein, partial [Burkholderiaceae bacterium]|nr:DNA translocase FtsK 4TM domain-containing protein [Burkholderiaceae bacterium]
SRLTQEALLLAGLALLVYWMLALASHSLADPAWTRQLESGGVRNWGGRLGAWLADLSYFAFGFSVWWLVAAGLRLWLTGLARYMRQSGSAPARPSDAEPAEPSDWAMLPGLLVLLAASAVLEWTRLYRFEPNLPGHGGGVLGYWLGPLAERWLGFSGSGLVAIVLMVLTSAWVFRFSWGHLAERVGARLDLRLSAMREKRELAEDLEIGKQAARERDAHLHQEPVLDVEPMTQPIPPGEPAVAAVAPDAREPEVPPFVAEPPAPRPAAPVHHPIVIEPTVQSVEPSTRVVKERQKPLFQDMPDSHLPQVDLLDAAPAHKESVSADTLEMTSRLIEKKLKDFGVQVSVVAAAPGPVITRYEIEPATGVKGAQVVNLAKDLARSLSLVSIRVVETIPGKNYMALELPNAKRQTIRLSEILGSQVYADAKSLLTMGLGKDIIGQPIVADLAKMPHVLVAGTTGSGKSVGINGMILSLLYKAEPKDVRLLMIDPKMLEMSVYEGIPHLLAPVVTDMRQAAHGLNWCVAEMERRYKLMSKLGVRNLAGYNAKIDEAKAREVLIPNPFSLTPESPEPLDRLPHIVVVIDELADLMMVVGKKIEELIARLAQKARAAGIHLILATQRPSVDVITGLIKANIPTRIAFQVSSKIDSRTILDQMGAEALLGMGDMLYMASGTGLPVRVHGAFVSDDEVHRVVEYLKSQGEPNYIEGVLEGGTVDGEEGGFGAGEDSGGEKDPMYDQAVEVVLKNRKASISLVQRHLKIGYNRAARLVEDMEKAGLVSAMTADGKRDILVPARSE